MEKPTLIQKLTKREQEVLYLIHQGYNNSYIVEILQIDIKTVERHISGIKSKVQIHKQYSWRVVAANYALDIIKESACI